jgi:P22 coat protein - gene protein 5
MADNTFITPSLIAKTALATLHHSLVFAGLVWRDFDADFTGKQGDTVTIRKPATFTAEEFDRAKGISLQEIKENSTTVELDTIANVSVPVTDEEMTLDIEDFETQVLNGMVVAIAEKIDGDIAELAVDTAAGVGGGGLADGSTKVTDAYRTALAVLGRNKLPLTDRYAVLSPEAHSEVLGDDKLVKVNESGTSNALRNAVIGDLLGFVNYTTGVLGAGAGNRGEADGLAFHKQALALVVRPLNTPKGVAENQVSRQNYGGLSMRVVYAYNNDLKQDEVSVDVLYGKKALRPEGILELDFGQGS